MTVSGRQPNTKRVVHLFELLFYWCLSKFLWTLWYFLVPLLSENTFSYIKSKIFNRSGLRYHIMVDFFSHSAMKCLKFIEICYKTAQFFLHRVVFHSMSLHTDIYLPQMEVIIENSFNCTTNRKRSWSQKYILYRETAIKSQTENLMDTS